MASKIDSATVNPLLLSNIEFFGYLAPLHIRDSIDESCDPDPVRKLTPIGGIFEGLMKALSRKSLLGKNCFIAFAGPPTVSFGKLCGLSVF